MFWFLKWILNVLLYKKCLDGSFIVKLLINLLVVYVIKWLLGVVNNK